MGMSENDTRLALTGEFSSRLESVPRISPWPVIIILMILGGVLAFLAEFLPKTVEVTGLGILLILLPAIGWILDSRNTYVGRWFTVIVLVVMVVLADGWLHLPGSHRRSLSKGDRRCR